MSDPGSENVRLGFYFADLIFVVAPKPQNDGTCMWLVEVSSKTSLYSCYSSYLLQFTFVSCYSSTKSKWLIFLVVFIAGLLNEDSTTLKK